MFSRSDHLTYCKLKRWAERRHPKKSRSWVRNHYWHTRGDRNWQVGVRPLGRRTAGAPRRHAHRAARQGPRGQEPLRRRPAVLGEPGASRLGRHPELSPSKATLLKQQKGRCARCGLLFLSLEEFIEVDHRTPRRFGGDHGDRNRQLLHGHCHDEKTAKDGSLVARDQQRGTRDKGQTKDARKRPNTVEEPDEGKPSRPVL